MAKNKVIAGDYLNHSVADLGGTACIFTGILKHIKLTKDTVSKYEVMDESHTKSAASIAGRGLIGGLLLGPVGLLAGALSAKAKGSYIIAIEFTDGKKSLMEVDSKIYQALMKQLF